MNFISRLPNTWRANDAIWIIVDRPTKSAHFLLFKTGKKMNYMANLYVSQIVRLHGAPLSIISDRDNRFVLKFWTTLKEALETKLHFSTTHHPQSDGQTERMSQTLEDMLRAYVLNFKTLWDEYLNFCGFLYENSFHFSIGIAPYEALYVGDAGFLLLGTRVSMDPHW